MCQQKYNIGWMSDNPCTNTGFASVSRDLLNRLNNKTHFDCKLLGHNHLGQTLAKGTKFVDGSELNFELHPGGRKHYAEDIISWWIKSNKLDVFGILLDSVTSERCIPILNKRNFVEILPIEEVYDKYRGIDGIKTLSMRYNEKGIKVSEWKNIKGIERRFVKNHKIIKINQKYGGTRITEKHSLVIDKNRKLESIKPKELYEQEEKLLRNKRVPHKERMFKVKNKKLDLMDFLNLNLFEYDDKFVWIKENKNLISSKINRFLNKEELKSFCRFIGAYVSEGCVSKYKANYCVVISNNDINWLKQISKDAKKVFKRTMSISKKKTYNIVIYSKIIYYIMKDLCGKKCRNKKFPGFIYELDESTQIDFLNQMIKGDGHHYKPYKKTFNTYKKSFYNKNMRFNYSTTSLKLASCLSYLLQQLRINFSIMHKNKEYGFFTSSKNIDRLKTHYKEQKYTGYIYDICVEDNENFIDACGMIVVKNTFMVYPWFLNTDTSPAKTVFYFPSDGGGRLPLNCESILQRVDCPVAMSKFAQRQAWQVHKLKTEYIPHAVDMKLYYPYNEEQKQQLKKSWNLQNKFIVGCFQKGTPILLEDFREKFIENICVGDKVITHKGISKQVTKTFKRKYKGKLHSLKVVGISKKISATEEHPILSVKRETILCKYPTRQKKKFICRGKKYKDCWACETYKNKIKVKWNKIKDLNKGDYVLFPIPKEEISINEINIDKLFDRAIIDKYSKSRIPSIIPLTNEFLELIGLFLAEGNYIKTKRSGLNGITFTFNIKEKDYVKFVQENVLKLFNLKCNIYSYKKNSTTAVHVMNKLLAHLFYFLCKEYAQQKEINSILMKIKPEKQYHILNGFYKGDGSLYKNKHCSTFKKTLVTTSEKLVKQLFIIALRNKIRANINERKIISNMKSRTWTLNIYQNHNYHVSFFVEEGLLRPILSKNIRNIEDDVFNFEVEDDNSYVVNNIAVHNCVARNQGRKMMDRTIKAFGIFAKGKDDVVLLMHTDPNDNAAVFDLTELVIRYNLQNKVLFTGTKYYKGFTYQQMRDVYNLMDVFFLSTCFVPDTNVSTKEGVTKIKNIKIGDEVLTSSGTYEKVEDVITSPYKGNILCIKPYGLPEVKCTPNHKIFRKKKGSEELEEVRADELKPMDYVMYPIPKTSEKKKTINTKQYNKLGQNNNASFEHSKNKDIPKRVFLDYDFGLFCGLYLSEGCSTKDGVVFSFHWNEKKLQNLICSISKKLFYKKAVIKHTNHSHSKLVCHVKLYGCWVGRMMKDLFGSHSYNKHFPEWYLDTPKDFRRGLLEGLWKGDGCFWRIKNKQYGVFELQTVSEQLGTQTFNLIIAEGFIPTLLNIKNKKDCKISGSWYKCRDVWSVRLNGDQTFEKFINFKKINNKRKKHKSRVWKDEKFVYFPLHYITKEKYSEVVYDLSINKYSNYNVYFQVHNSGEGFGIPTIEAAACGVPSVVTDYTTTQELLIDNGQCGYAAPCVDGELNSITGTWNVERGLMDVYKAAGCLNKLYDNAQLRETFGRAGIAKVEKFYDWNKVAEDWNDLLLRVVEK